MGQVKIIVAKRIETRWAEYYNLPQRVNYEYVIAAPILQRANVSAEEFKKCWFSLLRGLSNDELFSLFKDSGFTPSHGEVADRLTFVRMVLQRCNGVKVFLFLRAVVSTCILGFFFNFSFLSALHYFCMRAFACLRVIMFFCMIYTFTRPCRSHTHRNAHHARLSLVLKTISHTNNHHLPSCGSSHAVAPITYDFSLHNGLCAIKS